MSKTLTATSPPREGEPVGTHYTDLHDFLVEVNKMKLVYRVPQKTPKKHENKGGGGTHLNTYLLIMKRLSVFSYSISTEVSGTW